MVTVEQLRRWRTALERSLEHIDLETMTPYVDSAAVSSVATEIDRAEIDLLRDEACSR